MNCPWNFRKFEYHIDRFIFRSEKLSIWWTLRRSRSYACEFWDETTANKQRLKFRKFEYHIDRFIFRNEKVVHMLYHTLTFLRVHILELNHYQWIAFEIPTKLSIIFIGLFSELEKLFICWTFCESDSQQPLQWRLSHRFTRWSLPLGDFDVMNFPARWLFITLMS